MTSFETMDQFVHSLGRLGTTTAFHHYTEFRTFPWNYDRMYVNSLKMARFFQLQGLGPGDKLVLWAANSPQWVSTFFGCILSGLVAVPIDLRSNEGFVREIAREVGARLIFRTRFKPDPGLNIPQIFAEDLETLLLDVEERQFRTVSLRPSNTLQIVYTSGTLARPKGVILTHQNIVSELRVIESVVPPEKEYRFLSLLPLSHILEQVIGLLVPLSRGATVVYLDTLKPSSILESLKRERITTLVLVPRLLELLRTGIQREVNGRPLLRHIFPAQLAAASRLPPDWRALLFWPVLRQLGGKLEYIVCGGAELDPDLERFWDKLGVIVLQGYGLTETASAVTCNRIGARKIGSVGQVLSNQEARIAADGEILVRGDSVTPGYYGNESETAAAFEDGWLKTGDVGTFDPDGFLFYRGRKKDVIVTSAGLNIYPEDIEGVLNHIEGVREASVVGWKGTIHAMLLLEAGAEPRSIVQQANWQFSPGQQIQGFTVWPYEDFPRTTTLKVRRRDLLEFLRRVEAREQMPPAPMEKMTRLERIIARVSPEVTGALRPEATLGLDLRLGSIDRLELVSNIEQELGVDLPDESITAETTVAQLESMVSQRPRKRWHLPFQRWSMNPFAVAIRDLFQRLLLFPLLRLFFRLSVKGLENMEGVDGPVIFAPNHQTDLDTPVILTSLPHLWRRKTAVAAWAEYFEAPGKSWPLRAFRWLEYYFVVLLVNIFPLPHQRIFRENIKYAGELVDRGWSILFFPEGQRTITGEILPFREGIGLLVSVLRVPVIPVGIIGLYPSYGPFKLLPISSEVIVRFGKPVRFRDESRLEITSRIEKAVRELVEP